MFGLVRLVAQVTDHQELVAAKACKQAFGTDRGGDAPGRFDQQFITGVVAEQVVDHLEAVQVDVQHRHAVVAGAVHAHAEIAQHRIAVHDAGQRVGARLHAQGFLGLLALGDVLHGAGDARGIDIAGRDLADHPDPERVAIAALALQLQAEAAAVFDGVGQRLLQGGAVVAAQAVQQVRHVLKIGRLADDAPRLIGEVQALQATIPLPAADVGQ
ncbi:hypothetical protein D3C72_1465180 [compost metagenome]